MSMYPATTSFVNILVFVKPDETAPGGYKVITSPAAPLITEVDTVINYQIFDSDGYNIVFTGMTVSPEINNQLSEESVSVSGKLLTFSDANTEKVDLNITLQFQDKDNPKLVFSHDPQIINHPPT